MIYIEVRAISPLVISSQHFVSNENNTMDYIPGSVFRGAIAQKLLMEIGEKHPEFKKTFIDGAIYFGNLYPLNKKKGFPIPKSARTCKYLKGFRKTGHGVFDWLLPAVKFKIKNEIVLPECPVCRAPIDDFTGYYMEQNIIEVTKRLITRTAINESTLTARDEFLYTLEVIEEEQEFWGIIDAQSTTQQSGELINQNISIFKEGELFWVGSGRTRGLGNIVVQTVKKLEEIFAEEFIPGNLENRFDQMQKKLSDLNIKGFSLDLYSDAIIIDKFFRYKSAIDEDYLMEEFGIRDIEFVCAFNNIKEISGWNAAWGLPKEKELAIEKGSVFFFKYNGHDEKDLLKRLRDVEIIGIGLRKEEGFGRVYVCDLFHVNNMLKDRTLEEV